MSAVIPTIGRPEVVRAVKSVAAQSYPTTAILVVARPEAAGEVNALLAREELEAEVIVAKRPLNGSEARNLGVDVSDAEFVAFLDDDDWWEEGKVERQVAALLAETDRHAVSTCKAMLKAGAQDPGGRIVPGVPYREGRAADYLLARPRARYGHQFMQTSCLMGWRETFVATPWNPALVRHQDWDLLIRLFDVRGIRHVFVPDALAFVAAGSRDSVSRAPHWEPSLEWLRSVNVGARSRNDFVVSVAARAAVQARSLPGLVESLRALRPAVPHMGALLALADEVLKTGFPYIRKSGRRMQPHG